MSTTRTRPSPTRKVQQDERPAEALDAPPVEAVETSAAQGVETPVAAAPAGIGEEATEQATVEEHGEVHVDEEAPESPSAEVTPAQPNAEEVTRAVPAGPPAGARGFALAAPVTFAGIEWTPADGDPLASPIGAALAAELAAAS
jgi:hypothetical protein